MSKTLRSEHSRAALVTGGGSGIGAATARALAERGHSVAITYRSSKDDANALAEELTEAGHLASAIEVDVRSAESVDLCVAEVERTIGAPSVVVNNAGWKRDELLAESDPDAWLDTIQTNLVGTYYVTRRVLPSMIAARWGRVINVSSGAGQRGSPSQTAYCASKSGIDGLTRALAREVGRRNVLVNAVAPGLVPTKMTSSLLVSQRQAVDLLTPLKRMAEPDEIAAMIAFLASDAASYVNGQVIAVDGGLSS